MSSLSLSSGMEIRNYIKVRNSNNLFDPHKIIKVNTPTATEDTESSNIMSAEQYLLTALQGDRYKENIRVSSYLPSVLGMNESDASNNNQNQLFTLDKSARDDIYNNYLSYAERHGISMVRTDDDIAALKTLANNYTKGTYSILTDLDKAISHGVKTAIRHNNKAALAIIADNSKKHGKEQWLVDNPDKTEQEFMDKFGNEVEVNKQLQAINGQLDLYEGIPKYSDLSDKNKLKDTVNQFIEYAKANRERFDLDKVPGPGSKQSNKGFDITTTSSSLASKIADKDNKSIEESFLRSEKELIEYQSSRDEVVKLR